MTRLREATERLAHAVAQLESACENRVAEGGDRQALEAALAAARQERDALDRQRQDVAERLDAAIARLSAALDAGSAADTSPGDADDRADRTGASASETG